MLALQMFGTFFVLVKVLVTKSWGRPSFLQVEALWGYRGLQAS